MDNNKRKNDINKTVRFFEFLQQIANLRTKSVRSFEDYEKTLWLSDIPNEKGCYTQAWNIEDDNDLSCWIAINNQKEPQLPPIPEECKNWVDFANVENKSEAPKLKEQIIEELDNPAWLEDSTQAKKIINKKYLNGHPQVQSAWDNYLKEKWSVWVELHNRWEKIHNIYTKLFTIYSEKRRLGEEYEIVLGLGLLTWKTSNGNDVKRHLITARAEIEFDPEKGKFLVLEHPETAQMKIELDMLDLEEQPLGIKESTQEVLQQAEEDPWERQYVEAVLKTIIHALDADGEYNDALNRGKISTNQKPIVTYAPALILRKRVGKSHIEAMEHIKREIQETKKIPNNIAKVTENLQEVDNEEADMRDSSERNHCDVFDGEIFFPKPSNEEQKKIVKNMRYSKGILVQGPPGTGKSHTIANLICHLLAKGQRILVTAQTTYPLNVLAGHLPEEIQPLCISLLGNGQDEKKSLENSVNNIMHNKEFWSEEQATAEQKNLERKQQQLKEEKVKLERQIRDIRESETMEQSIAEGRYKGTATNIIKSIDMHRDKYDWFEDVVKLNAPCPVSEATLYQLLQGLRQFTPEKAQELAIKLPKLSLSSEDFAELIRKEQEIIKQIEEYHDVTVDSRYMDYLKGNDESFISALAALLSNIHNHHKKLMKISSTWQSDIFDDVISHNMMTWQEIARITEEVIANIKAYTQLADDTYIDMVQDIDRYKIYQDVCVLNKHLSDGGSLGNKLLRPKIVRERLYILKSIKINSLPCDNEERLKKLEKVLHVHVQCDRIWKIWRNYGVSHTEGDPYILQLNKLNQLCEALKEASELELLITEYNIKINNISKKHEPKWSDLEEIEQMIAACQQTLIYMSKQQIEAEISQYIKTDHNTHPINDALQEAIKNRDISQYERLCQDIQQLEQQALQFQKFETIIKELEEKTPKLVQKMQQDYDNPQWDHRIKQIEDAYYWAQARSWVKNYIHGNIDGALDERLKQVEDEINQTLAQLAANHAWSFCSSRLTEEHQQHMQAWKLSFNRIGKGTGKHANHHRRTAQNHLNACRDAIPAWIMPISRVWDTIKPSEGMFDVIIVDEASQCGIGTLPLLYLGKKIVIVGDDKQISPAAVGLDQDKAKALGNEYLSDFTFKNSFNVESSLFDIGKLNYGSKMITLREHFRCMPEIIRFSNDLCYSNTPLIPLRQYGENRLKPLEHVFIEGGFREGTSSKPINPPEADAIVDKILELYEDSRYDNRSMGVISLQGLEQAKLIERKLLARLDAGKMEQRKLLCGDAYSFQGDERDVILLSMVAAPNQQITALTKELYEQRYNVAASRAKDQLFLFHSVTVNDLNPNCCRRKLLEFFENPQPQQINGIDKNELERQAHQEKRTIVKSPSPFDSWFELDVALEILRKGYNVVAQYLCAGKRIDLVVEGGAARLAVECDGDYWHGEDQYYHDRERQRMLERCGWAFFRVRSSTFYANKDYALKKLWPMLEERGILPLAKACIEEQEAVTA